MDDIKEHINKVACAVNALVYASSNKEEEAARRVAEENAAFLQRLERMVDSEVMHVRYDDGADCLTIGYLSMSSFSAMGISSCKDGDAPVHFTLAGASRGDCDACGRLLQLVFERVPLDEWEVFLGLCFEFENEFLVDLTVSTEFKKMRCCSRRQHDVAIFFDSVLRCYRLRVYAFKNGTCNDMTISISAEQAVAVYDEMMYRMDSVVTEATHLRDIAKNNCARGNEAIASLENS